MSEGDDERSDPDFYVPMSKRVLFSTADMVAEIKTLKAEIERLQNGMLEIARCASIESAAALAQDYLDKE